MIEVKNKENQMTKQDVLHKQETSKLNYKLQQTIASDYSLLSNLEVKLGRVITNNCSLTSNEEILIGLHEILCNAIKHGNKEIKNREVSITLRITEQYLEFRIVDQGTGFKWREKQDQPLNLIECTENGRGIVIAERCYDYVFYNEQGNKVFLFKQLMRSDNGGVD